MTDNQEVYHKPERKRELIRSLQNSLDAQLKASEELDSKAWQIMGVASATFGIAGALIFTNKDFPAGASFKWGVLAAIVLYLCLLVEILQTIKPLMWHSVPGGEDGKISFESLLEKYIYPETEDEYLDKLIVDYVGKETPHVVGGALQHAQDNNAKKSEHIRRASLLLGMIILALAVLPFLASLP